MSEATKGQVTAVGHNSRPEQELELDNKPSSPSSLCSTNPQALAQEDGRTSLSPDSVEQIELTDVDCKPNHKNELGEGDGNINKVTVKPKKVRQRLWTTVLSAIVACIPFLLVGCTLGFPSGALLDLTDLEERTDFKLTREQADLFGVRQSVHFSLA